MTTRIVVAAFSVAAALSAFACGGSMQNQSPDPSNPSSGSDGGSTLNDLNKQLSAPSHVNESSFADGGSANGKDMAKPAMTPATPVGR